MYVGLRFLSQTAQSVYFVDEIGFKFRVGYPQSFKSKHDLEQLLDP